MKLSIRKKQSGQALVEMAFIIPVLILLLVGAIEVGRYAYISILIGNAARAGAAYGAQSNGRSTDTVGIQNAADYDFAGATSGSTGTNGQPVSKLTITSSTTCGCDSAGTFTAATGCTDPPNASAGTCAAGNWVVTVTVTATGNFNALFNYPGIPSPITITRSATMRVS